MIVAAGEDGCGFEAQLEGWYRFLIDPEPPAMVGLDKTMNFTVRAPRSHRPATKKPRLDAMGTQCASAATRQCALSGEPLRPDSLVAIVMLSERKRLLDPR